MKIKKINIIIMAVLVGLTFCGCAGSKEADISDFSISIKLPKERFVVGDSIEAEIQFVNLTNKNFKIIHSGDENKSSFIGMHFYLSDTETEPIIVQNAVLGHKIKRKEVINKKQYISLQESGDYYCYAYAHFKIGDKSFLVKSEKIKIKIEGEN